MGVSAFGRRAVLSLAIMAPFAFGRATCIGRGGNRQAGAGMDRQQALEERVAHLQKAVEDLSDVVAAQAREIARLTRHVGLLMEREAEREAEGGAIPLADQRPPHW